MKTKLVNRVRAKIVIALGILLIGGCGKAVSSSGSGSNTNWLESCDTDADCGAGAECWCHVCVAPCNDGVACEHVGASCQSSADKGCGERAQSASICVASCQDSSDCRAFGAGLQCLNEACVATPIDAPGGGGSGGTESSGDSGGSISSGGSSTGSTGTILGGEVGTLAMGEQQRCLTSGGRVYCWGGNSYGQAGGDPLQGSAVHVLSEVPNAVEIAAGTCHTCARTSDGDVYCWGRNDHGEIGSASAPKKTCPSQVPDSSIDVQCQPTPTRVAAISGARHIAVGDGRSCAVLADDSVVCWGDVSDISEWAAGATAPGGLALGPSGACAITAAGTLSCSRSALETAPLQDLETVVLSPQYGEERFGCALGAAGDVHCWGDDSYGQLGQPGAQGQATYPINDATQVVVTGAAACALVADGSVWCWGRNTDGEAGLTPLGSPNCGAETCETAPHRVENLPKIVKLAAGVSEVCAVAEDAVIWCWGVDSSRAAGTPARFPGPWEGGESACQTAAAGAREALSNVFGNSTACTFDDDCTEVSLDLPCLHSCESVTRSKADIPDITSRLEALGHTYCDAAPASCDAHAVSCSHAIDKAVCYQGTCVHLNLETSGCTNACACAAERSAASVTYETDCSGPDLFVVEHMDCPSCGTGGAWFVIGNRGDATFSGTATLSFDPENPDDTALIPAATALDLNLAPGERSKAVYVESLGEVSAHPRITGAGDCLTDNDAVGGVTFPGPLACP